MGQGNELHFLMTISGQKAILLLALWCCDCLDGFLWMERTEGKTCPILQARLSVSGWVRPTFQNLHHQGHCCWYMACLYLLCPFIKDRHADNNQFCRTAPWLLCSIPLERRIMPIHGTDNETCVLCMTFIIVVVWWLPPQLYRAVTRDLLGH